MLAHFIWNYQTPLWGNVGKKVKKKNRKIHKNETTKTTQ